MMKKYLSLFVFLASVILLQGQVIKPNSIATTGPSAGTLVIAGGGEIESVLIKFISLAGGEDAEIIVVPTADGATTHDNNSNGAGNLRKLGAKKVTVLHTYNRDTANMESFANIIDKADAVWFGGGRQWRLVDAYKNTLTEQKFHDLLKRGGVIGGTSAGATIQGSFLVRGDTQNNQVMMGDHREGFAFVKNIAIDQHVLARNRHFDLFEVMQQMPGLLGIAIDEGTAVIVNGNTFEVTGKSYVIIFDGTFWSREGSNLKKLPSSDRLFYFLRSGDKYDMVLRKVIE